MTLTKFECGGGFDLRPDVKYPHLSTTTLPNLGAKLHFGAIRNELCEIPNPAKNYKTIKYRC